jgi:hypothetical protein
VTRCAVWLRGTTVNSFARVCKRLNRQLRPMSPSFLSHAHTLLSCLWCPVLAHPRHVSRIVIVAEWLGHVESRCDTDLLHNARTDAPLARTTRERDADSSRYSE